MSVERKSDGITMSVSMKLDHDVSRRPHNLVESTTEEALTFGQPKYCSRSCGSHNLQVKSNPQSYILEHLEAAVRWKSRA